MPKQKKLAELRGLLAPVSQRFLTVQSATGEVFCRIQSPKDAVIEVVSEVTAIELQRMIQTIN